MAEGWEDFYCPEDCPEFIETRPDSPIVKEAPVQEKKEAVKLCETCKEKPVIHPNSKECASCMAKRAHKAKDKAPKEKKTKKAPSKKQSPRTGVDAHIDRREAEEEPVILVHFDGYGEILEEIERLAKEETRTVELQVIHLLKRSLAATPPQDIVR